MRKLWELVWPPVREDNLLLTARERMLNVMALTIAVLGGFAGTLNYLENIDTFPVQAIAGLVVPVSAALIPLVARDPRRVQLAGIVLCIVLYLLLTGMVGTIGGMAHPAAIFYAGLPIPAAFLIGYRAGMAMALLSCATMLALYFGVPLDGNPFAGEISRYQVDWTTTVLEVFTLGIGIATSVFQHELEGAGRELDSARLKARAASRAKSDFLASISHEIRTPMNAILGMAQALEASDIDGPQKQQAETLARSGRLLLRLVNDVLDLSKIEAGKMEIEATQFSLPEVAATVEALYGPAARDKGVDFRIATSGAARAPLIGDPVRISQILNNLVSNAIKFTAAGEVRIDIDAGPGDTAGHRTVTLRVSDTGIGITPDQADRLFQPFTQADAATTRTFGGTGLGLAISRRLCTLMDGDIELDSTPGAGSTFTVRLQLRSAAAGAAPLPCGCASPACDIEGQTRALRVLAADDNETNRLVLQALLADATGSLVIVDDGQAALDALDGQDFDVVLLDSQMPVLDGIETTRRLRARERARDLPALPVYAVTASVMPEQVDHYLAAGMTGVIAKPVSRDSLLEALARHADTAGLPVSRRA